MARGKVLTPKELAKLGAKQLAELLVEACESDPQLRHRVEILQASNKGADEFEGTLAKRIVSLSRARAFVDWREVPKLEAELAILREGIVMQLGAEEPRSASELMWRFLAVAKTTIERVDDSSGRIGDEFRCAAEDLGSLLTRVPDLDRVELAERLHERMAEDEYGFAGPVLKSRCTTAVHRRITRWEHEHVLEAVQKRLDEHPEKMRQRREMVRFPFDAVARLAGTE